MPQPGLTRRTFLKTAATAAGAAALAGPLHMPAAQAAPAGAMPDTSKMNVLLIDIEDFTPNAIACYGNAIVKTPNMDRLAATGTRFDRAYIQYPCCNPSRTSFLTGLRPPTTRVLSNEMNMSQTMPPGIKTLPELMKARGFYCADVGKLFHTTDYAPTQLAVFDRLEFVEKPPGWQGPGPVIQWPGAPPPGGAWAGGKPPKKGEPRYAEWKKWSSDRYGDSGLTEEQQGDGRYARTAASLLKEFARDKRHFFLCVGSQRPHTPLLAPKKYIDMYDPAKIPDPPAQPEQCRGIPDVAHKFGRSADIFSGPGRRASPDEARAAIAAYYACVSYVDAGVGIILDALEATGLAASTVVILLGDHGFHLGEHGLWSKYTLFESSTRAPLIVRVPGAAGGGKACRRIVEFVDLVPTLCDLAGLERPANLEGTSFAPLLSDPDRPWKKAAYTWFGNKGENRSVRSDRCRYAEWLLKGEKFREFYDLAKDPWETVNLVDDPACAAQVAEHARLLEAGWKAALPQA
ncbi:MAG: sulfatase [Planctomycetes bacterium]|nr:sulfatase [Planctomycetota bacterium]